MSRTAQILRTINSLRLAQRYFASRKVPDYYKALGIKSNATTKDIKAAFIKLSKQMHPDANNKQQDHNDFVKISEAYNILSKDRTRSMYDAQRDNARFENLNVNYPYETMRRNHSGSEFEAWQNYYKQQSGNSYTVPDHEKISPVTIAFGCVLLSIISFLLQMLVISKSPVFNRNQLLEQSQKYMADYKTLRERVIATPTAENVDYFMQKIADNDRLNELKDIKTVPTKEK